MTALDIDDRIKTRVNAVSGMSTAVTSALLAHPKEYYSVCINNTDLEEA